MKKLDIDNTTSNTTTNIDEVKTYPRLVPDGYVCKLIRVEDTPEKEYLKIEFDIKEGPLANYYQSMSERLHFWGGSFIRSYKQTAIQFFVDFIRTLQKSNPSLNWDFTGENDEHVLEGLTCGLVLQDEEYRGRDGSVKHRMRVAAVKTVDDIRSGNFSVPEPKTVPKPEAVQVVTVAAPSTDTDDDIFAV